jgi:hypothetical protein
MDTKLHIKYGFRMDNAFFGWHEGVLYQLPYQNDARYFGLRKVRLKVNDNGWEYYHIRRKKVGIPKLRAMLQKVDWEVEVPIEI